MSLFQWNGLFYSKTEHWVWKFQQMNVLSSAAFKNEINYWEPRTVLVFSKLYRVLDIFRLKPVTIDCISGIYKIFSKVICATSLINCNLPYSWVFMVWLWFSLYQSYTSFLGLSNRLRVQAIQQWSIYIYRKMYNIDQLILQLST